MRLLYDAVLPKGLSHEAPTGVEFVRWDGDDVPDTELVRAAAERGYRGVVLLGRDSLAQSDLRKVALQVGVVLVAIASGNPMQAKQHILRNLHALYQRLNDHDYLLVYAANVRPYPTPTGDSQD